MPTTCVEQLNKCKALLLQEHTRKLKEIFYLPLRRKMSSDLQATVELELLVRQFLADQAQVLLLQGSAGTGKTLFCHHLAAQLLECKDPGIIPLYISLKPEHSKDKNLIMSILQEQGFSAEQITELRQTQKFLFIFDGYEQLRHFQNIYITYQLEQWQAKVIVTCRPEYFIHTTDYYSYFIPYHQHKPRPYLFKEFSIAPLADEQVNTYLEKHALLAPFQLHAERLFFLKTFSKNPLFLKMITHVLSKVQTSELKDEKQMGKTPLHSTVLKSILEEWFSHQEAQLKTSGLWDKDDHTLKRQLWEFSIALAQEMQKQNITRLVYKAPSRLFETSQTTWAKFFNPNDFKLTLLYLACPFLKVSTYQYEFIHEELLSYLAAQKTLRKISIAIPSEPKTQSQSKVLISHETQSPVEIPDYLLKHYLNQKLFTKDRGLIQFLADRVLQSERFINELLGVVFSSKQKKQMAVGAANAITILNIAKIPFIGIDLAHIQVPEADLSYAILSHSNLSNVNLQNANLSHSVLYDVNLQGADLRNVNWGEYPCLKMNQRITTFAHHPTKPWVVIAQGKTLILMDTETGEKIGPEFVEQDFTMDLSFSPDGEKIASGGGDNSVCLWNVATATSTRLTGHTEMVMSVSFSSNGKQIVSGSEDKTLRLWNIATDPPTSQVLVGHTDMVKSVSFSSNGKQIVSGGEDRTLRLWDITTDPPISQVLVGHTDIINSVAFSPNGKQIVSGSNDKTICIWDASTGKLTCKPIIGTIDVHYITSVSFSPDGNQVVSASSDKMICLWDVATGHLIGTPFTGHTSSVDKVVFSGNGKQLASSSSDDKTLRLWDVSHMSHFPATHRFTKPATEVMSVCFNSNATKVAFATHDNTLHLQGLDTACLNEVSLLGHTDIIVSVSFSHDGKKIVSASHDKTIRVWDVATGRLIFGPLVGHVGKVNSVSFSSDDEQIVSGSEDRTLYLWNITAASSASRKLDGHTKAVTSVCFSPDDKQIVSGSEDATLRLWNITTSSPTSTTLDGHTKTVTSVCFSPDGSKIASGSYDSTIRLWEVVTGSSRVLRGYVNDVAMVSFSPNGKQIVSVGWDETVGWNKTIRLWDTINCTCLSTLHWHRIICGIDVLSLTSPKTSLVSLNRKAANYAIDITKGEYMLAIGDEVGMVSFWGINAEVPSIRFLWMALHPHMPLLVDGLKTAHCKIDAHGKRLLAQYGADVRDVAVHLPNQIKTSAAQTRRSDDRLASVTPSAPYQNIRGRTNRQRDIKERPEEIMRNAKEEDKHCPSYPSSSADAVLLSPSPVLQETRLSNSRDSFISRVGAGSSTSSSSPCISSSSSFSSSRQVSSSASTAQLSLTPSSVQSRSSTVEVVDQPTLGR